MTNPTSVGSPFSAQVIDRQANNAEMSRLENHFMPRNTVTQNGQRNRTNGADMDSMHNNSLLNSGQDSIAIEDEKKPPKTRDGTMRNPRMAERLNLKLPGLPLDAFSTSMSQTSRHGERRSAWQHTTTFSSRHAASIQHDRVIVSDPASCATSIMVGPQSRHSFN